MTYAYSDIIKNMHFEIIESMHGDKDTKLCLTDALCTMCAPIVFFQGTDENEWKKKKIFLLTRKNLGAKFGKWRQYTNESLVKVISNSDWVKNLKSDEIKEMLEEFKIFSSFSEDDLVSIDSNLFETYTKLQQSSSNTIIRYGNAEYVPPQPQKTAPKPKVYELEHPVTDNDMELLKFYVDWCINNWEYITLCEKYKWKEMICWRENFDLDADDLYSMLKAATKEEVNLFKGGKNYYPLENLKKLIACDKERVRNLLRGLFDETQGTKERVDLYCDEIGKMTKEYWRKMGFRNEPNNLTEARSCSTMLMLNCPSNHYIYKYKMFQGFKVATGIILPAFGITPGEKVWSCDLYCDDMRKRLLSFTKLVQLNDETYKDDKSDYHMMTQNFFYAIGSHYNKVLHGLPDTTEILPYLRLNVQGKMSRKDYKTKRDEIVAIYDAQKQVAE